MNNLNKNFLIIILFCFMSTNYLMGLPIKIIVVFPFFIPLNVQFGSNLNNNWQTESFDSVKSDNTYFISKNIQQGNYEFNVRFNHTLVTNNIHIATALGNLNRIVYAKVYINGQLIGNNYVNSDNNINFSINENGNISPVDDNIPKTINDMIPPEVHWPSDTVFFTIPPAQYTKAIGWAQVLHDNNFVSQSRVEVDYIKLYARKGITEILLDSTGYDSFNQTNDGGLYIRYPFFPSTPTPFNPMPAFAENGILVFYPSTCRDSVWHWWNPTQPPTDPFYTSYYFEVRYKIIGKAAIQIGIDFRDASNNTLEGAVSSWGFDTFGEWEILRVDTKEQIVTNIDKRIEQEINFELFQNFPNPFNYNTHIKFVIPNYKSKYHIELVVFDALGNKISTLMNCEKLPGNYEVDFSNEHLSSGVYFYQLKADNLIITKKLILLK